MLEIGGLTTVEQYLEVLEYYLRRYNTKRIQVALCSHSSIESRNNLGITA